MMTIGKFKGRLLAEMTTPYLMWLVSNDHIRHNRWLLVLGILAELRRRFDNYDNLLDELAIQSVPEYWKTPEQKAQRILEKAEKLKTLEQRRSIENLCPAKRTPGPALLKQKPPR